MVWAVVARVVTEERLTRMVHNEEALRALGTDPQGDAVGMEGGVGLGCEVDEGLGAAAQIVGEDGAGDGRADRRRATIVGGDVGHASIGVDRDVLGPDSAADRLTAPREVGLEGAELTGDHVQVAEIADDGQDQESQRQQSDFQRSFHRGTVVWVSRA